MPSESQKQHWFMNVVAHNPKFAKKAGVKQSVGKKFVAADKGQDIKKLPIKKKQVADTDHDGY